jgi:hypothetical protein
MPVAAHPEDPAIGQSDAPEACDVIRTCLAMALCDLDALVVLGYIDAEARACLLPTLRRAWRLSAR